MKRQQFHLNSVLRHYELQKQRTELELQRACQTLQETAAEIVRIEDEIAALAKRLYGGATATFSTALWIASSRKSEQLGQRLAAAHARRLRESAAVAHLQEARQKWSVAEETLCSLQRAVDTFNRAESDKAQQEFLDENVLQKWLLKSTEATFDA